MELDRLEKRIRALQARKAARAATFERVQGIDPTEHEAAVYHAIHADIAADAHTYYNLPGGRGSCKSSFVSLEIVDGIQKDPTGTGSAVVFRRWGSTLRESVFAQIQWAIDALGVSDLWACTVSPMRCTYLPTGAQIIFRGLDDNSKIKSIKPAKGFFRWVWFEEFSELPGENFVRSVMQSVGRGGKPVVFRSFNPPVSLNNWANKFIQQPNEEALTLHTDYTQVPPEWLGEVFLNEAQHIQALNPKVYDHEYLGIPTGSGGEVFTTLEVREIADEELAMQCYRYVGCDFGLRLTLPPLWRCTTTAAPKPSILQMKFTSAACQMKPLPPRSGRTALTMWEKPERTPSQAQKRPRNRLFTATVPNPRALQTYAHTACRRVPAPSTPAV